VSYDWLLFLHVLAAFCAVTAVVMFVALYLATDDAGPSLPGVLGLSFLAGRLWDVGGAGTLIFGIWLAIHVDGYSVTDGWILAAIVLWAIAGACGARVSIAYAKLRRGTGARAPLALHLGVSVGLLLLLIDMIYKPGA